MENFFKLKENGTTVSKELVAGLTTFFAMVYIIFVNPTMLSETGMPWGAVFLATIIATVIGTLIMGIFANVPYAVAPGMGLNAFFTYTVVFALGFTWKEALGLVFICGLINVLITVTNIRKSIIVAIPESLQHAIGGGIGIFIAYIGFKNAGMLSFTADPKVWGFLNPTLLLGSPLTEGIWISSGIVPAMTDFSSMVPIIAFIGLVITIVLLIKKVKGAILIGIIITTLLAVAYDLIFTPEVAITTVNAMNWDIVGPFKALPETFGQAFVGIGTMFSDLSKLPMALLAIFAFSLTDTFDTIGTFVGTGRKTGIFTDEDLAAVENGKGFKTKMEKALLADAVATSIGAVFGTSNTTTFVESSAGIEVGGKTGLTSVFTAIFFAICMFLSPVIGIVPGAATAPALIVVGIMMIASFKYINWTDLDEAVPAFFAAILMALAYNISIGIAFGFIFYIIVKLCQGRAKEIHPVLWGSSALFLVYFVLMALFGAGIIK